MAHRVYVSSRVANGQLGATAISRRDRVLRRVYRAEHDYCVGIAHPNAHPTGRLNLRYGKG